MHNVTQEQTHTMRLQSVSVYDTECVDTLEVQQCDEFSHCERHQPGQIILTGMLHRYRGSLVASGSIMTEDERGILKRPSRKGSGSTLHEHIQQFNVSQHVIG